MRSLAVGALNAVARGANASCCIASSSRAIPSAVHLSARTFASSSFIRAAPPGTTQQARDAPPKGPVKDDAIALSSDFVRLVDPKSGALAGPFNTKVLLSKLDRTKFFLLQVAPPQPDRASVDYDPDSPPREMDLSALVQFPICKLIDKKEEFDKQRALKRKASEAAAEGKPSQNSSAFTSGGSKEVQLTWSVSKNDLGHKLSKARKEMLKGARINVVVTTKSGGKKYIKGLHPKEDEKRLALLDEIEGFLCKAEQEGDEAIARRLQDVDWQRGGSAAVMSFECFRK